MAKSKYEPMVLPRFDEIRTWLETGLTERQVATNLGVSKTSLEVYKHRYPDFLALIKRSRRPIIREYENALSKRALGYEYTETKTYIRRESGKTVEYVETTRKHMAPDVGALAILLKNKADYSDNPAMLELRRRMVELEEKRDRDGQW